MKHFEFNGTQYEVPNEFNTNPASESLTDQRGSTCELYALEYALYQLGVSNIRATGNKKGDQPVAIEGPLSLRKIAKVNGFTQIGEILDANHIPQIVSRIEPPAGKHIMTMVKPYNSKNMNIGASYYLVPFDVCMSSGKPCSCANGAYAHWCVVVGGSQDKKKFLVYHWGQLREFDTLALDASNRQLETFLPSYFIKWKKQVLDLPSVQALGFLSHYKGTINDLLPEPERTGNINYTKISEDKILKLKEAAEQSGMNHLDNDLFTIVYFNKISLGTLKDKMVEIKLG